MWSFNRLPKRIHKRFISEFRQLNIQYLKSVIRVHKLYTGCVSCLSTSDICKWIDWAIEQKIISDEDSTG